jgi:hypothetical protein
LANQFSADKPWGMKKCSFWIFAGVFAVMAVISQSAVFPEASATTMPMNHLNVLDNPRVIYNISPMMFRQIIDQVAGTFSPVVRAHGGQLQVNYLWNNSTVNASADRNGNIWILNMYGGLARRKEITPDGFSMVVCHELGHHLGGYPFTMDGYWAADEGEADYFAAHVCAPAIWARDVQGNAVHRYTVDPVAKQYCDRSTPYQPQRDICYRTADAAQSLANVLNLLDEGHHVVGYRYANNMARVPETNHGHPAPQCRLETYLNGALCRRSYDPRVIPGIDLNMNGGSLIDEEKEAAKYSCGERGAAYDGSRPRCWFQPVLPNWY